MRHTSGGKRCISNVNASVGEKVDLDADISAEDQIRTKNFGTLDSFRYLWHFGLLLDYLEDSGPPSPGRDFPKDNNLQPNGLLEILTGYSALYRLETRECNPSTLQKAFGSKNCIDQSTISDTLNA